MLRHLHFDAMQSDARIGYCGAMHLESRLQTGWECEKRGCLPFFRRIPVATDSDCVECDDQQLAYQRGTVIHVPILVRSGEGYGIPQLAHRRQLLDKHDRSSSGDATDRDTGDRNPYGAGIVQDTTRRYRGVSRRATGGGALQHRERDRFDVVRVSRVFHADQVVAVPSCDSAFDGDGFRRGDACVSSFDHKVEDRDERLVC